MHNIDITTFSMLHVWTLKPRGLRKLPRVRALATVQVFLIKGRVHVHGHPFTHAGQLCKSMIIRIQDFMHFSP